MAYGIGDPSRTSNTYSRYNYYTKKDEIVTSVNTVYDRYLIIEAYDDKNQVWKITVKSSGSSGNLSKVMPVLILSAMDYFGVSKQIIKFQNKRK